MTDFIELCQRRQSCRRFSAKPVEREKLVRCAEAARLCPSGCNSQPWSFILVRKPELVAEVAQCAKQLGLNEFIDSASAFFVVIEERAVLIKRLRKLIDSQTFAEHDVGAAALAICLAAEDQGIGTCQLGVFDRERLSELLDIPVHKRIRLLIAAGYPEDEQVRSKSRKPLEEILRVAE